MKKKLGEILAPMTFSEKISYLWEYYKIHFIVTIVVLIFIGTSIASFAGKKEIVLNIVVMGEMINSERIQTLQDELNVELLDESELDDKQISLRYIHYSSTQMDQQSHVGIQKMAAEMTSKSIDLFILDKTLFDQFSREGSLVSLSDFAEFDMNAFEKNDLYFSPVNDGQVDGVNISVFERFMDIDINGDKILCIPLNAQNIEMISQFFEKVQ